VTTNRGRAFPHLAIWTSKAHYCIVKVVFTVAALLCEHWSLAHAQKRVEAGLFLDAFLLNRKECIGRHIS
jgi:hypothetical protein